jgi:AAA+ ATPase superfamily predicted ATPase
MQTLNRLHLEDQFQCVVMYGRRRVGKTRLLSEFCQDKRSLFYVGEEHNDSLSLDKFSMQIKETFDVPAYLSRFETWEQAFLFLAVQAKDERLVLVIDEFPYLVGANQRLLSSLQNVIDHHWLKTKLFVVLCGSSIGFMEHEVLAHKSPLFGRRTAQFKIMPLSFYEAIQFVPSWSDEDKVAIYSILGGVPQYLLQFNESLTLEENIKRRLLDKSAYLYGEPNLLLNQEFRNPTMYRSIIEAIASGASRLNEITTKVGEESSKTAIYLKALIELQLVLKQMPIGEKASSRKTVYRLSDSLLLFYYKFVSPNLSQIEREMGDYVYHKRIEALLPEFYGKQFEEICKAFLIRQNQLEELPFVFDEIGSWWGNNPIVKQQEEIDIVAYAKEAVILAECKYRNEPVQMEVLHRLMERGICIASERKYYYVFSKSGFASQVEAYAKIHENITLVSLEEVVKGEV